jgi:hypothetical protein
MSKNDFKVSAEDCVVLRNLAVEKAEASALAVHGQKAVLWRNLNDMQSVRPMVWINEIPWNEMNVNDELTLRCENEWARNQELQLRKELYQWRHMPGDMILDPWMICPLAIHSTGFGIDEKTEVVKTDESNSVVSRHFEVQISSFDDLEKIKMPIVTHREDLTAAAFESMQEIYDGILPVRKRGKNRIWFTPWDYLIRWTGIEEAMLMMYEEPDLVHAMVDRVVDAWMTELDQLEAQNLLSLNADTTVPGSGGYGYTSDLPGDKFDPDHVRPHNMWGCSNAQIFSEVSPEFHWEFAVEHDLRWMKRWGLNYYGCCEPLHGKADVLARIPNLRKVTVSPWCKTACAIEALGGKYVLSRKPNPAILAEDVWHPERARKAIREFLDATEGKCHVELIMKDISTVRYQPQRLWEWSQIAMEEAERAAR